MCGLVGIAGDLAFHDEAMMKRLLLLDWQRGPDSTGMAAIRTNGDAKVAKIASHPIDLFDMGRFKDALNGAASRAFIGHNRAATRGLVNTTNAHPFHCGHIVGAHNGTLDLSSTDRLEKALGERFPVDSMAIITGFAKLGVEDTIEMCSDDGTDGHTASAWSLVWFDQDKGTINFLRNKKRPLWYAMTKDFKRLVWASEFPFIQHAVQMSGGKYDLFREEDSGYIYRTTEENVWYEYDLAAICKGGDSRPKAKAKVVKGRESKIVYTGNYSSSSSSGGSSSGGVDPFKRRDNVVGFARPGSSSSNKKTTDGSRTTLKTNSTGNDVETKEKITWLESDPLNPLANLITPEQFAVMSKDGCTWCGESVHMLEPGLVIYDRDDIVLCPNHSGTSQTRVFVKNALYL
jgi:hypothetical protein